MRNASLIYRNIAKNSVMEFIKIILYTFLKKQNVCVLQKNPI